MFECLCPAIAGLTLKKAYFGLFKILTTLVKARQDNWFVWKVKNGDQLLLANMKCTKTKIK
jgi:hypothetical protein